MTAYMIPAARVYQVTHIRDPNIPAQHTPAEDYLIRGGVRQLSADSHDGQTVCGQLMFIGEQWIPATAGRVCGDCEAGAATYQQEAMI